jgi:multicomponent K+:H+ antiporter subunit E
VKRWFPSPLLSLSLFALWLVLNDSVAPGHLLLGALAGWLAPVLVAPLKPPGPRLHRPLVLARLILRVGGDVVLSALEVARGILRAPRRPPRGAFVTVPLDLHDGHGLAALAIITAVIPGTVWSELAADHGAVLIHVFDLQDEAAFIADFKARYELPLKEIFE